MKQLINESNGKQYKSISVGRCDTKNKILDIIDSVDYRINNGVLEAYEKVTVQATDYSTPNNSLFARHFMDLEDFRLLAKKIVDKEELLYEEFKGSKSDKYPSGYEARTLKVNTWAEGFGGKGAYNFTFTFGEGQPGDKGQVMPKKGAPTTTVKVTLPIDSTVTLVLEALSYFDSKRTAYLAHNYTDLFSPKRGE